MDDCIHINSAGCRIDAKHKEIITLICRHVYSFVKSVILQLKPTSTIRDARVMFYITFNILTSGALYGMCLADARFAGYSS